MEALKVRLQKYAQGFARAEGTIPLNNAALAPLHARAATAMQNAIATMSRSRPELREEWRLQYRAAHQSIARLLDCTPSEVCFMPNVATAFSSVAQALEFKAGDELVTIDQEYASNAYPWRDAAARAGAKILVASSAADYAIENGAVEALIGPRTRAVAVSWVQFQTGASLDILQLSRVCKKFGALLIVDGTQGVGIAPFSMAQSGADIVAGSLHKWLGGPPGLAYLAIRRDLAETLEPRILGPYSYGESPSGYDPSAKLLGSAARFQTGTPALLSVFGAAAAADAVLEVGVEHLSREALALARLLHQGLLEGGHRVLSPLAMTSPLVSFLPRQGLEQAAQKLAQRGISFALRAGGLRLSPHVFNTRADIEESLRALS